MLLYVLMHHSKLIRGSATEKFAIGVGATASEVHTAQCTARVARQQAVLGPHMNNAVRWLFNDKAWALQALPYSGGHTVCRSIHQ